MDRDIDGPVLLVGEANFSFTLSFVNYVDAKLITTSCYENKNEALRKYGAELVEQNEQKLSQLGCNVLYGIDACNLKHHFPAQKFTRIIFMFPHVGGKSNLKKNRLLLNDFFRSARESLDIDSDKIEGEFNIFKCKNIDFKRSGVYVALAKGQGGTRFEMDPLKRNNKDSWQILSLAQANGFILTECFNLDENRYNVYKSTGFRSQHKSFITNSSLVHRFELSLLFHFPNSVESYLSETRRLTKMRERLSNADKASGYLAKLEPFAKFKRKFAEYLHESLPDARVNLLEYNLKQTLSKEEQAGLDASLIKLVQSGEHGIQEVIDAIATSERFNLDDLNIYCRLSKAAEQCSIDDRSLPSQIPFEALNDFNYEIAVLFHNDLDTNRVNACIKGFISKSLADQGILLSNNPATIVDQNGNNSKIILEKSYAQRSPERPLLIQVSSEQPPGHLFVLDLQYYMELKCGLNDKRILYSDDIRTFHDQSRVKPYSIENPVWVHDISFWYNPAEFSRINFIQVARDYGQGFLIDVKLLDNYEDLSADEAHRHSACFRFSYQAFDVAFTWENSKQINSQMRNKLAEICHLSLR